MDESVNHRALGSQDSIQMEHRKSVYQADKYRIIRNVLIICAAFFLLFTAYGSLQALQSSINSEQGLGTASLSVIYGSLVLSCMFVPPILIRTIGCKWTIVLSMTGYVVYMVCNFWMSWYTLIPGSFVLGLGAAPLWGAKCTYLTEMSTNYAQMSREVVADVIARFFGYFFFFFQSSSVVGNVISSTILGTGVEVDYSNLSIENCGSRYCKDNENNTNLKRPDDTKIYTLMGVYTGLSVLAIILILFIDNVKRPTYDDKKFEVTTLLATFLQMKDKYQLLLIPITIFSGLEQGYITSEFTKAYVSCTLGIWMVGYVMMCYGALDAVGSALSGKLNTYIGRIPIFLSGAVIHSISIVVLLLWRPGNSPSEIPIFFVMAGIWGLGDSIWQTQINALYGAAFPKSQEAAFANYRLWESVGFILAFGYSNALCVNVKTYIVGAMLVLGITCYGITEYLMRHDNNIGREGRSYSIRPSPAIGEIDLSRTDLR